MKPVGNLNTVLVSQQVGSVLLGVSADLAVNLDQPLLQDGLHLLGREGVLQTVPEFLTQSILLYHNKLMIRMRPEAQNSVHILSTPQKVYHHRTIYCIVPLRKENYFKCHLEKGINI